MHLVRGSTLQPNTDPLRLQETLPAFPFFKFTSFPNLVSDLGLSQASYLDTYIPTSTQWEQHRIETVRRVESQQRLLYKVRRSLTEGLAEEDCVNLDHEMRLQYPYPRRMSQMPPTPQPSSSETSSQASPSKPGSSPVVESQIKGSLKRSIPEDVLDSPQNAKIHVSSSYYINHTSTSIENGMSSAGGQSDLGNPQSPDDAYMYQNPVFYAGPSNGGNTPNTTDTLPSYLLSPHVPPPPIPYHPHPPLKRWPNDYTVSELSQGFHAMDLLVAQSPPGSNMTQKTAFERVFGSRYVKSTVCRHRAVWRKASPQLRQQFEAMGIDDRACWGEFVRRVEGRPPGKGSPHDMMSPSSTGMGYHDRQTNDDDDDIHGEDVMGMQQNQGRCSRLGRYLILTERQVSSPTTSTLQASEWSFHRFV